MEDSYNILRRERKCVAFIDTRGKIRCEKNCLDGQEFCSEHFQRVRFNGASRTGIVYIVYLGESSTSSLSYYKIGITKNLNNRIKSLRLSNPKASLVKAFGTAEMYKLEKKLHDHFKDQKIERETFLLSDDELQLAIDNYFVNK